MIVFGDVHFKPSKAVRLPGEAPFIYRDLSLQIPRGFQRKNFQTALIPLEATPSMAAWQAAIGKLCLQGYLGGMSHLCPLWWGIVAPAAEWR